MQAVQHNTIQYTQVRALGRARTRATAHDDAAGQGCEAEAAAGAGGVDCGLGLVYSGCEAVEGRRAARVFDHDERVSDGYVGSNPPRIFITLTFWY